MGSGASDKLRRVKECASPYLINADRFPLPEDGSDWTMADAGGLLSIRSELRRGWTGWSADPSDDGRKLRDISRVLTVWWDGARGQRAGESETAERDFIAKRQAERATLRLIERILSEEKLDEIDDWVKEITVTERAE